MVGTVETLGTLDTMGRLDTVGKLDIMGTLDILGPWKRSTQNTVSTLGEYFNHFGRIT